MAAEGLIAAGVSAVFNATQSLTGKYPAQGALLLLRAGIPVIDEIGVSAFNRLRDGSVVSVEGNEIRADGTAFCSGKRLDLSDIEIRLEAAREAVSGQLGEFATNTLQYLANEPELITEDLEVPTVRTTFAQRQVLVVVRGIDYREDLGTLKRSGYVSEMRPILIGVDGGQTHCWRWDSSLI